MGTFRGISWAIVACALLGLSKASYDPAATAYVGDTVPYAQRGRVIGLMETSWAMAWLLGVPIAGFLIESQGWQSPFRVIAVLALLCILVTWRFAALPTDADAIRAEDQSQIPSLAQIARSVSRMGRRLLGNRSGVVVLFVIFLLVMANENLFIVYGAWIEEQYGLGLSRLGVASVVIAVAELVGEIGTAAIADRAGKRRSAIVGLILHITALLVLPQMTGSLSTALLAVALMMLTFEFSIVCLIPLVSELAPNSRGAMLALSIASMSIARSAGTISGPRLWQAGGLAANACVSVVLVVVAVGLLVIGVRERMPLRTD
jgi:predicted MFS family arabinose efflux permease